MQADLLITNIGQLVTCSHDGGGPATGSTLNQLHIIENGAIACLNGEIVAVGPRDGIESQIKLTYSGYTIDASGKVVTPGLVDPHTHPVFAATREDEFEMRNLGRSYMEIAEAGGGIRNSVRKLREASKKSLYDNAVNFLDLMMLHGTTTVEAKSGYGLSTESEIKQLEVIQDLSNNHAMDVVPTFLGAHEIPDEYRENPESYILLLIHEMIPEVAKRNLAVFCDIFCEKNVFEINASERIMTAARVYGFQLKFHADEIRGIGGAELAARMGAVSADHLDDISDEGIDALVESGTIGVLLPGTIHFLDMEKRPPVRRMIERGVALALATDFNPGSSATISLQMIMNLAAVRLKMTAAEIMNCVTINAAHALRVADKVGSIEPGKQADFVVWEADNYRKLPYFYGFNQVDSVIKRGKPVGRE
jgi:imidazolonepropionase